jgi:hypothetical protein
VANCEVYSWLEEISWICVKTTAELSKLFGTSAQIRFERFPVAVGRGFRTKIAFIRGSGLESIAWETDFAE